VTGTEHFQAMSTSKSNGPTRNSLVAFGGAFTAGGVDVQNKNNTDTFRFPGGTLHVTHRPLAGTSGSTRRPASSRSASSSSGPTAP
jgi:hypothetical protein